MAQQLPLNLPHDTRYSDDGFMVSASNAEAAKIVERWPDWDGPGYIVQGEKGAGKTHILKIWADKADATYIDMANVAALESISETDTCLALDNLEGVTGDRAKEEAVFHLLNRVLQGEGAILCAVSDSFNSDHIGLKDVASRLSLLGHVTINMPDDQLWHGVFLKQLYDRQLSIDAEALQFLSLRLNRSFEEISKVVEELDTQSLAEKRKLTLPFVKKALFL